MFKTCTCIQHMEATICVITLFSGKKVAHAQLKYNGLQVCNHAICFSLGRNTIFNIHRYEHIMQHLTYNVIWQRAWNTWMTCCCHNLNSVQKRPTLLLNTQLTSLHTTIGLRHIITHTRRGQSRGCVCRQNSGSLRGAQRCQNPPGSPYML